MKVPLTRCHLPLRVLLLLADGAGVHVPFLLGLDLHLDLDLDLDQNGVCLSRLCRAPPSLLTSSLSEGVLASRNGSIRVSSSPCDCVPEVLPW